MDDRLEISAVLKRTILEICYIGTLFPHAKVGTGSPRRIAQLKENFNVEFEIYLYGVILIQGLKTRTRQV